MKKKLFILFSLLYLSSCSSPNKISDWFLYNQEADDKALWVSFNIGSEEQIERCPLNGLEPCKRMEKTVPLGTKLIEVDGKVFAINFGEKVSLIHLEYIDNEIKFNEVVVNKKDNDFSSTYLKAVTIDTNGYIWISSDHDYITIYDKNLKLKKVLNLDQTGVIAQKAPDNKKNFLDPYYMVTVKDKVLIFLTRFDRFYAPNKWEPCKTTKLMVVNTPKGKKAEDYDLGNDNITIDYEIQNVESGRLSEDGNTLKIIGKGSLGTSTYNAGYLSIDTKSYQELEKENFDHLIVSGNFDKNGDIYFFKESDEKKSLIYKGQTIFETHEGYFPSLLKLGEMFYTHKYGDENLYEISTSGEVKTYPPREKITSIVIGL